jgi:mono/diheme cytochrome c family protein
MRAAGPLAVCAIAAAVMGCGDSHHPRGVEGPRRGADVFARECSACHSAIGNDSLHRPGGDLLVYRLSRADLVQFARQMPVRDPLSAAQLRAVVDYIAELEQKRKR